MAKARETVDDEDSPMEEVESVSDSEIDLNREVFDDTPGVKIPRRGLRYWGTVVRRSSIGWFSSASLANHNHRNIQTDRTIDLLRTPSVQTFTTLKKKLNKAKNHPEWILQFLSKDGLGLLFESLEQLCNRPAADFLSSILQVSCVECVRTIMDTSLGLDYIVDNKEFTEKLAKGKILRILLILKLKSCFILFFLKKKRRKMKVFLLPADDKTSYRLSLPSV